MPNEKQIVRVLTEPTIVLDDLKFVDTDSKMPEYASKQYGGAFPLMQINNYPIPPDAITNLRISISGDIPTMNATIIVRDKSFYSTSFPKDGDIVTIFIRGKVEPFKPIHNDYEITAVDIYSPAGSREYDYDTMNISGVLRVPGYDAVKCFSKNGTSMNAVLKVATDLKLGFASNEVDTADHQSWICPFNKVKDFLHETTLASWKDEKSFYTYFIDHYYYLNFVNVEPFYSEKPDIEDAIATLRMSNDYGKDSVMHSGLTKNILSNWDEVSQTQFYLTSHSLINNTSSINLQYGYKCYAQYYDGLLKDEQSLFIDPKTTEGAENTKQLLKGRPRENFYLKQINTKWMGVQYGKDGENCHPKYNYAKVTNFQNNIHLNKMGLRVTIANPNFNLRRMQTIPVVIMVQSDAIRKIVNVPTEEMDGSIDKNSNNVKTKDAVSANDVPFLPDRTISGFYVVHSIDYVYDSTGFRQECILLRREWDVPPPQSQK